MSTSGIVRRIRLGDDVTTYCGRCKEERNHQVVALNSAGGIERVTCRTCHSNHLYRDRPAKAQKTDGRRSVRLGEVNERPPSAQSLRGYSATEAFSAGDWLAHPKFGAGEVIAARSGKIEVRFGKEVRILLHAG